MADDGGSMNGAAPPPVFESHPAKQPLKLKKQKVAVLFGNNKHVDPAKELHCARQDVVALTDKFHENGFLTWPCLDVSRDVFWQSIDNASTHLISGETQLIVFHWSGHGQVHDNKTWLYGSDGQDIDLARALERLQQDAPKTVTMLVILDHCRNVVDPSRSPLPPDSQECDAQTANEYQDAFQKMSVQLCEAKMSMFVEALAPHGPTPQRRKQVFLFACGQGEKARECKDAGHGYVTLAVLEKLFEEGDLTQILKEIKTYVRTRTYGMQGAWTEDNCGEFFESNPVMYDHVAFKVANAAFERIDKCEADAQRKEQEAQRKEQEALLFQRTLRNRQGGGVDDAADARAQPPGQSSPCPSACRLPSRISIGSLVPPSQVQVEQKWPWIAIDGNIGVGKSTLLANLVPRKVDPQVHVEFEPLGKWEQKALPNIYDPNGDAFYAQNEIWLHFQEMADKYQLELPKWGKHGFVSERSPISVVQVFCKTLHKQGRLTDDQFENFEKSYELLQRRRALPTHHVVLHASVETCMQRIERRGRPCEKEVTEEYLASVSELVEAAYSELEERSDTVVIHINANVDDEEELKKEFLAKVKPIWQEPWSAP